MEKFAYHQRIPHLICGVWPIDEESEGIAHACLQQYHDQCDRISYRNLSPATPLGQLFRQSAVDGCWHLKSQFELKAMNLSPTAEQYLEGGHAFAKGFQRKPGGPKIGTEQLSMKVRWAQTDRCLSRWDTTFFGIELWGNVPIVRQICARAGLPKAFCNATDLAEMVQALYFNHDRQLFSHCHDVANLFTVWDESFAQEKTHISQTEKLALSWLRHRLCDSIVSLPPHVVTECVVDGGLNLVAANDIMDEATLATLVATELAEVQSVTDETKEHVFFRIVNVDLAQRYYHNDCDFHKFSSICAMRFNIGSQDPSGNWWLRHVERHGGGRVERTDNIYIHTYIYISISISINT